MPPPPLSQESLRCAAVTRSAAVDPIGSAGSYEGFLLLELPLPWPRDIGDMPVLAPVVDALRGTGIRLQGLVPAFNDPQARRAVLYRRCPPEQATAYGHEERIVASERLVDAALELLGSGPRLPDWTQAPVAQEVLICTHGQRDVCCGSLGTTLALELVAAGAARLGGDTRLWRTSHTGGHRFAPTAVVLPHGTAWAYLDADAVRRIVRRSGPLEDLLPRYRGCTALPSPEIQALDRVLFGEVGWPWLDRPRQGEHLGDGRVRLHTTASDGRRSSWEARVEVGRTLPVPECGRFAEESRKSESELVVRDLIRTA